ncbi:MAG: metallophosphoesterase [Bacteroidetes bacterium]|nr:metallophosphoesterase [Bacteroidota bacterium]
MNGVGLVIMMLVLVLIEYYAFSAFRFAIKSVRPPYKAIALGSYIAMTLVWFVMLLSFNFLRTADMSKGLKNFILVFFMGFLIAKVLIAIFLLLDDVRRLVYYVIGLFYANEATPLTVQNGMTRSAFMTRFALLFGGTMFATLLHGMSNRYNYRVRNLKLKFDDLPAAFKGLKIVHISDIHSGSFNDPEAVQKGVLMINEQKPDLILFTGDLVNNKSEEMYDYRSIFSKLSATYGVYSILGNHDYGDYVEWENADAKKKNLDDLKSIHAEMGWRLLLNEHVVVKKGNDALALLGVENISAKGFNTYGDLSKAYAGSENHVFKILMSHDPSHWDSETTQRYKDIHLTLSGHTHGMQFGVEIPWLKWSPVQYAYNRWAGLYQQENQYLYVNRGFGFLGYPGRVGILPEITVLELDA